MKLIDVHAHLERDFLPVPLDELIANAKAANVKIIIANGVDPESNRAVLELVKKDSMLKPALGFYPTHVTEYSKEEVDAELKFIKEAKPIALGEVGLDYKFSDEDKPRKEDLIVKQKDAFRKILKLAKKMNVPVIVHSRKAELDVIEMIEEEGNKKVIMHCFMGKKRWVARVRENGWTFSIPVVLLKLQQTQEIVRDTPLHQLLTETDTPYLGPEPGLTNEPKNVALTIVKIAEIKKMTVEETADQIFMNYMNMFY